jgi:hypothetical protein
MKRTLFTFLLLTAFILSSSKSYAQQNNTISVVYGTGSDNLFGGGIGSAGYASKGTTLLGLDYIRHLEDFFSIETGLEYSNNQLLLDYIDTPTPNFRPEKTSVQMLSVPVYGNFTFFKYTFLNAGFSVDFETDHPAERIAPEQNGIGMFLGIGGKYAFKRVTLFVNPFLQLHNFIRFSPNDDRNLVNSGFKFGVGYNF